MKEYKKSYIGLVWWTLLLVACYALVLIFLNDYSEIAELASVNVTTLCVTLLMFIIYKTEKIYWINGVPFEIAKMMSSEQRKKFASVFLFRFGLYAGIYLLYSFGAYFLRTPWWVSVLTGILGLVAVAISTVNIKLE